MVVGIILLILGIALFIIGRIADFNDWDCNKSVIGWLVSGMITFGIILICIAQSNNKITPMDVYQGKTTLQYTIVDGVKIDSVVVWKIKEV